MTRLRRLIALVAVTCFSSASPLPSQPLATQESGPSFACTSGQGPVETAVCGSPMLSAADRTMAALYATDRVSAFGIGASNIQAGQRKAIRYMQNCVKAPLKAIADCLKSSYDQRSVELATAAVVSAPDLALPVLRRLDPAFAPVAEAIGLWAAEPQDAQWSASARAAKRARIAALLKPLMTDIQTKSEDDFARSVLADRSADGIAVTGVDDLFKSERHFAAFLSVVGSVLPNSALDSGRAVPCAALVHHPRLLDATASAFGSTMDMTVLNTDCEETLPSAPALTALNGKLQSRWPDCEGTIRFAAYRTYQVSLDSARLGFTAHDSKATIPRRRGVTAADVKAARNELAAYYARYLGASPARSVAMAADALSTLINAAHECE